MWRFSDGTAVHLGGKIEGDNPFADELREALCRPTVTVSLWPRPSALVELDVADPMLLDAWLKTRAAMPCRSPKVTIVERPDGIPPVPEPPWGGGEADPDFDPEHTVY